MHKRYIFFNVTGSYVLNEHFRVMHSEKPAEIHDQERAFLRLAKRFKGLVWPEGAQQRKILAHFSDKSYFRRFRDENIRITKADLALANTDDQGIIQAQIARAAVEKSANAISKSVREWLMLSNFEEVNEISDDKALIARVTGFGKGSVKTSIPKPVLCLAKMASELYSTRDEIDLYIDEMMRSALPNVAAVAGSSIGAKLLELSGSLKRLARFPASTVQLLGAEEALFRHLKSKAKPPKYGVLHEHPAIAETKREFHGKAARILADKISIAAKVDYFKGKFIGDEMAREANKRLLAYRKKEKGR